MELIVYQMLNDGKVFQKRKEFLYLIAFVLFLGHHFEKPEYIMANLQQGIW